MLNRIGMKTLFGAGAVAALMTMYSCNRPKGEEPQQPKTELQKTQEILENAQNEYAADSAQFVCMAKDSTALKEKLAKKQQARENYFRINDNDTNNKGKQFDDNYRKLAENIGEKVPVDSNLVEMDKSIKEAQLKVDIATGKVAEKSKAYRDKALQDLEREAERAKEQARQDSIRQARLKNDPLHQKMLAEREKLEKMRSAVEEMKKIIEEQEKKDFEVAKLAKQLIDAQTKSRKDSIMNEFRKIQ